MKKIMNTMYISIALATYSFASVKEDYTNKIISGEIDPTKVSFTQYDQMNKNTGVDLKKEYTNKIISGEIDPTKLTFQQYKVAFSNPSSTQVSTPSVNNTSNKEEFNNEDSKAVPQKTKSVRNAIRDYLKMKGLKKGHNKKNNKYIITTIVPVGFPMNDPQFNDAVATAFEEAYMKAQEDLLMKIYGKTAKDKATSLFRVKDPNANEKFVQKLEAAKTEKERITTIYGKVKKLAEVKLDKALMEEGVDPKKLKGLTVKMKRDLFKKTFTMNITQSFSIESLLGSVPMQTFIGTDKRGNAEFGLVMMKSDITARVAMDMANKRAPRDIKSNGIDPLKLLPENDKDYLKEFGVRIFFDESGMPSLISYAQYYVGNAEKDDADMLSEDKSMGLDSAKMLADGQISDFLNTIMSANNKTSNAKTKGKRLENQINATTGEEEVVEKKFAEIVKTTQKNAKAHSEMDNAGTDSIYDWEYEDDNGDIFVGVVNSWSYAQLASAQAMQTGKNVNYNRGADNVQEKINKYKNIQSGRDVIDVNDF